MRDPVGAVLAGGRSSRYGSPKTLAVHDGTPLIWRPIEALSQAVGAVAVVCKPQTPLPELPDDTDVWYEEDERVHPLVGIVQALRSADGARVAVLGCDMPAATADLIKRLVDAGPGTVVAVSSEGPEPLAAVYSPDALAQLEEAVDRELPMRETVATLEPVEVQVDVVEVANVNLPGDLRRLPIAPEGKPPT